MANPRYNLSKYKNKVIAIDGPAGSGKSTTARLVAARLGFMYLDTGAMYRALTHFALKVGVSPSDAPRLVMLATKLSIEFETGEKINRVFVNGEEVTSQIRTEEVTRSVSEVSAHRGVREALVAKQREMAREGSVVAEGRDTTTVVFPKADLKVYLEASIRERAQRRLIDFAKSGASTTLEDQVEDINRRDTYDSSRKHSPMTKPADAITIDTTACTIEEQVERVLTLFKTRLS